MSYVGLDLLGDLAPLTYKHKLLAVLQTRYDLILASPAGGMLCTTAHSKGIAKRHRLLLAVLTAACLIVPNAWKQPCVLHHVAPMV